eukprot:TRINITY_DN2066_c0_g1_i2.p1 TRINITY_DN2066_c0_g1~~TRINITY_DN2066_c0_g1_i2.p1  ORF type:complete len:104 (-),score=12.92 TRINITY_DN2066_c0_g1_i2:360-671(-)
MAFGLRGQDAWRKHPVIANCHKGAFPGFGTAVLIVGAYIAYDQTIKFMNSECLHYCVLFMCLANVLHTSTRCSYVRLTTLVQAMLRILHFAQLICAAALVKLS